MSNSIVLTKTILATSSYSWDAAHRTCAFPFKVEVTYRSGDQLKDNGIFVLQRKNETILDPSQAARFVRIANAIDLEELPYGDTDDNIDELGQQTAFYRVSSIKLYAETSEQQDAIYDEMKRQLKLLITNLNSMSVIDTPTAEFVISDETIN